MEEELINLNYIIIPSKYISIGSANCDVTPDICFDDMIEDDSSVYTVKITNIHPTDEEFLCAPCSQIDSGAKCSVTNNPSVLHHIK